MSTKSYEYVWLGDHLVPADGFNPSDPLIEVASNLPPAGLLRRASPETEPYLPNPEQWIVDERGRLYQLPSNGLSRV